MPGGFHPPLSVIAEWPKPNYVNPEAKGNQLMVITIVFGVLTIASVVARLAVRIKIRNNAGLDDLFIFLALIPTLGITALFILIGTKYRWHRHIWDAPLSSISGRQYHSWVVQFLFVFSTSFSKISTLLLYRRVIQGTSNRFYRSVATCAVGAIVLYCIGFTISMIVQCRPLDAYWRQFSYPHPYQERFSCIFEGKVPLANAIISVATDFLTALLPMFLFRQLQLPTREKIALTLLFGVGFLVCIFGIVRTVLVYHIFYQTYDVTWASHDLWIWMNVENDLMIICSSIPPLRMLFKDFFSRAQPLSGSDQNHFRLIPFPEAVGENTTVSGKLLSQDSESRYNSKRPSDSAGSMVTASTRGLNEDTAKTSSEEEDPRRHFQR